MSVYAVNGTEPVAAWIPSLDTAGNGTTTLTDLVGSSDGTLTNMDAGSDWAADTGAGGVRALDFDGSNDFVAAPVGSLLSQSQGATSLWLNSASNTDSRIVFSITSPGQEFANALRLTWDRRSGVNGRVNFRISKNGSSLVNLDVAGEAVASAWTHVVWTHDGTTHTFYRDGSQIGSVTSGAWLNDLSSASVVPTHVYLAGPRTTSLDGLMDDVRVFSSGLDSDDIAYLYDSGMGRGIVASTGAPAQNAQNNNMRNIRMSP